MYSKANGGGGNASRGNGARGSDRSSRPPTGWEPAYRRRVQVPPNYSGNAIVDGEERPLGQTDEGEHDRPADTPLYVGSDRIGTDREMPRPRFDDLPRVSELGDSHRRPTARTVEGDMIEDDMAEDGTVRGDRGRGDMAEDGRLEADRNGEPDDPSHAPPSADLPASLPVRPATADRSLFGTDHFPFGHGFGFEEILLLGLILFLLRENDGCSDRGDLDETIILLGILLLCG